MISTRVAAEIRTALLLAAGIAVAISGCDSSPSSEFHGYQAAEGIDAPEKTAAAVDDTARTAEPNAAPTDESADSPTVPQKSADASPPADVQTAAVPADPGTAASSAPPADQSATATTPDAASPGSETLAATATADPNQPVAPGSDVSTPAAGKPNAAGDPNAGTAAPATPRKVEVLVKNREFKTEGPEGAIRVSYDDIDLLKVLNMEPVTPDAPHLMPDWLKSLDGRRIRIRGYMYPNELETGIEHFILARDNQICCFGRNPKIYDVFWVHMREGETTHYILNRPFDVVGVFHIQPIVEDGTLYQLYVIDDAVVIE